MTWNPDTEFVAFLNSLLDTSDTLLLGRKLSTGNFINFWENTANENPDHPFAKKIVDIPKVIFTKTLDKSIWNNTTLAKGNLAEEIANLKKQSGKDILVFGGAGFVSSLINEGLIDEYHLIGCNRQRVGYFLVNCSRWTKSRLFIFTIFPLLILPQIFVISDKTEAGAAGEQTARDKLIGV